MAEWIRQSQAAQAEAVIVVNLALKFNISSELKLCVIDIVSNFPCGLDQTSTKAMTTVTLPWPPEQP